MQGRPGQLNGTLQLIIQPLNHFSPFPNYHCSHLKPSIQILSTVATYWCNKTKMLVDHLGNEKVTAGFESLVRSREYIGKYRGQWGGIEYIYIYTSVSKSYACFVKQLRK